MILHWSFHFTPDMEVTVLILTPLPLEYDAVVKHLKRERKSLIKNAAAYETGTFVGEHHTYAVVVREPGMKNVDMALATERAILAFQPQIVLLVGIAGGVKDVKIGDVVVASSAFNYESGKETGDGFLARPAEYVFSEALLAQAQIVSRNPAWKKRTDDRAPAAAVVIGPIAAGDKVVAGTNNPTFQHILKNLSHIKALEMEAGGFGRSVQSHRHLHALVIRGISDLCAGKAETDQQNWQPVAAERAAAFAFELLDQLEGADFIAPRPNTAMNIREEKNKNILHNSQIQAGNNVHIGDIIHQGHHSSGVAVGSSEGSVEQFIEGLQNMVARGKSKEAIPKLCHFAKTNNPALHEPALHLSDRWKDFERKSLMGMLSQSEQTVARSQITAALLNLIGQLREE